MGDRTNVTLNLAKCSLEKAKSLIDDIEGNQAEEWLIDGTDDEMISFSWDEVNYTDLGFENTLQENNIPYDKEWGDGHDFFAGEEYFRVDSNGETTMSTIENSSVGLIDFEKVKEASKKDIDAVKTLIADYETENYVMPWREQVKILAISSQ